ncbi:synaptotagmin-like protein 1, partial [Numida meleagris]|uniref:synaptotagmin-like protein 1 n=1 Tax=Numida meleagris TaxID=8996 RepID=UPI000B3DE832
MELEPGPEALLDLSFLSEEERCAIAEVLRRDTLLRRREEGRVSKLRQAESDPVRLRTLTGEWFRDVRAQRHRNLLGSDLVRASIRCRRRPRGALELELSRCELAAIREWLLEEKEDEQGAREESPAEDRVPAAVELQPDPIAPEGTTMSPSPQHSEVPAGEWDGPGQPGDGVDGSTLGNSSAEEDEEEPDPARSSPGAGQDAQTPQDGGAPRGSALSASSSVSSLSSSTLSGSLRSLYSEAELGRVPVRGCVQFSLRYEAAAQELQVHVVRCRELAEAKRQRSDPYIKTYLLPDKSNRSKRKTSVRKRSLDPVFNETLKYKLRKPELQGRTLNLSVWHHDALGRNLFLG